MGSEVGGRGVGRKCLIAAAADRRDPGCRPGGGRATGEREWGRSVGWLLEGGAARV